MRILQLVSISTLLVLILSCGSSKEMQELEDMTDADLYDRGVLSFNNGKYEEALKLYELLLERFPTSDLHIDTQLRMAEAHGKLDHFEDQMGILLRLLKENIIPERVPEIYVQLGKFYERAAQFNPGIVTTDTTDFNKALDYYAKAMKYKDSDEQAPKAEALYRRALVEAKLGSIGQATEDYRSVTVIYPDATHALLAQIKLQDPENITELAVDDLSIRSYQEQLGLVAPSGEEGEEELVEEPEEEDVEETTAEDGSDGLLDYQAKEYDENTDADQDVEIFTPAETDSTDQE